MTRVQLLNIAADHHRNDDGDATFACADPDRELVR